MMVSMSTCVGLATISAIFSTLAPTLTVPLTLTLTLTLAPNRPAVRCGVVASCSRDVSEGCQKGVSWVSDGCQMGV